MKAIAKEILEGNKLIAEFMGLEVEERGNGLMWRNQLNDLCPVNYHHSWDWLMPVVRKIDEYHSMPELLKERYKISEALEFIDVTILYKAVIDFIKWHNKF